MSEQKVILITGTSRGIGNFLANHYLNQGHIVYGCSRSAIDLDHKNYHHVIADVTDEKSVKLIFKLIKEHEHQLNILINNAGAASMNHALLTPTATASSIFEVNAVATFICSREGSKLMKKANKGRIINFSSVAVPMSLEGEAIYASSKAAIEKLSEVLAKEFSPYNITVNTIGPTPIATDLIKGVPKGKIEELINQQSIKRMGTFDDVLNVIDFFIQDSSDFISGQTIYLGGVS